MDVSPNSFTDYPSRRYIDEIAISEPGGKIFYRSFKSSKFKKVDARWLDSKLG